MVDTHSDTLIKIIDDKTWLPVVDIGMDTGFHIDIPKKLQKGRRGRTVFRGFYIGLLCRRKTGLRKGEQPAAFFI